MKEKKREENQLIDNTFVLSELWKNFAQIYIIYVCVCVFFFQKMLGRSLSESQSAAKEDTQI